MGVEADMEGWYGGPRGERLPVPERQAGQARQTDPKRRKKGECLKEMPRIVRGPPLSTCSPESQLGLLLRSLLSLSSFSYQAAESHGNARTVQSTGCRLPVVPVRCNLS